MVERESRILDWISGTGSSLRLRCAVLHSIYALLEARSSHVIT
jgi:hypothetical protein